MRLWTTKTPDGELVLVFPPPSTPLSINKAKGRHWAANARLLDPWRDLAALATRQAMGQRARWWVAGNVPVTIQVVLPFRTAQRRDPHNYVGTVVKAVVDGVKTGGLIPDDTPEWATILEPTISIQRDRGQPMLAQTIIRPRS